MVDAMVPVVTFPVPVLDALTQRIGKALGCKDAGLFWTAGREWNHWDRWCDDYEIHGRQQRSYELRLWGLELTYTLKLAQ